MPKKLLAALSDPLPEEEEEEEDFVGKEEFDTIEGMEDGVLEEGEPPSSNGSANQPTTRQGANDGWGRFDSLVESWLDDESPRTPKPRNFEDQEQESDPLASIMCARCYSLRHYGHIKSTAAESELPGFDFEKTIGRKISLQKFRRSVVLMVVDLADFDGSLPRTAVRSLIGPIPADATRKPPQHFRLVVAANKSDLLPSVVTNARLEAWVRRRIAQGGLPRPSAVHIVSGVKGTGVQGLLADLQAAVGTRGDVWVIGAQNAGKSSLINSMRSALGLSAGRAVTVAPVPGTTIGVVPVPSLLPRGCKMLDTPGVLHRHQLAPVLTAEEVAMVLPRRALRPRTYRLGQGQTVTLGGVARYDVLSSPGATMYLTVWASDEVACHFGKTEGAEERYAKHVGTTLVPPVGGTERMESFPKLRPTDVEVQGNSWQESSVDVCVAGLGWVGVGVKGQAVLRVWAPPGVAITTRDSLVPDFAKQLERPGFGAVIAKPGAGGGGGTGSQNKQGRSKGNSKSNV